MALGVVIQIDGYDPVAAAPVSLRAGSHDVADVCHVDDGATWWPAIAKLPTLRYDFFDGAFEGKITAPSSTIELATEAWPSFGRYALADARFRLWTGEVGAAWSSWTQRVNARVTQQPALADGRANVAFAVDDRWLDQALLATYAGTTGIEGPAALKGIAKPLAIGAPRYAAGVLVDAINSVFQISAYGAIGAVEAALERLLRYGPSAGDYPTFAALVAAAIPAGRWATCLASGLVRFGAPPTGQVSFLLQGDVAGPNGWARRPGAVLRRLALLSGGAGRIDDATLDALDSSRPYNLSVYLDQQTTARELLQEIAASVNAVAGVSWMGKLFVLPVAIGAPSITLAADGSALPPTSPAQQLEMAPPFAKLAITAERSWTVHPLADVAFTATLVDLGAYAAGTTYREGNIVQHQGSTWLYINPAPSAGNAPPALPAEVNAFWKVLARAGVEGENAPLLLTQWSVDGLTGWHINYVDGDLYQRQSNDNGDTWGASVRVVGESIEGQDGISSLTIFRRSTTVPAAPANNAANPPPGWTDAPPAGTDILWQSKATYRGTVQLTEWSAPVRITGEKGDKGNDGYLNMLDVSSWTPGRADEATIGRFNVNGSPTENSIVLANGPSGGSEPLWKMVSQDAGFPDPPGSHGYGGWNYNLLAADGWDERKSYRMMAWVLRKPGSDGGIYLGTEGNASGGMMALDGRDMDGDGTNPYFWVGSTPQTDKWYLMVGILHGTGYTGGDTHVSGLYDPETGQRVLPGMDWKQRPGSTFMGFRA